MTMPIALFLSVLFFSIFSFLAIATWAGDRRKEREAFHRSEMIRKLSEAGETGQALFREQERAAGRQQREGLKIGGVAAIAVGIGLSVFMWFLTGGNAVYLVGLIPFLVGCGLLAYVFTMAPKE